MRGHDDLAILRMIHPPHQFQKFDLARWRQRRFRLVEDEDALPLATLFEEAQKALAMRMGEEVWRRTAAEGFASHFVEISGDRKETLGPEEPPIGDFGEPARAQRL